ncbi:MAG TPA: DUF3047 domain-containing protein [Polyangiaceae bacterium]
MWLSFRMRRAAHVALLAAGLGFVAAPAPAQPSVRIEPDAWRVVESRSGPVSYYSIVREEGVSFVRSQYRPPLETVVMGWQTPDANRRSAKQLTWSWRARTLPTGGNECVSGKGDSAAVVYATWKRGLRYYTLKYVWTTLAKKGAVCDAKRNPFVAQDTIVLRSGAPVSVWQTETVDLRAEFRKHFEDGDARADVPDFVGVGIMTDGDQTKSKSSADFGVFTLSF